MNYLAHGIRYVDRPYFLAGTAVPDWLSVADRRVRMRERQVSPVAANGDGVRAEIAAGVLQHLEDDDWFHSSRGFHVVSARIGGLFRDRLGTDGFRCGFLGHVVCEMLIDSVLLDRFPGRLTAYYAALQRVEPTLIEDAVNGMARRTTTRLAGFVDVFRRVRFLEDYATPERLLRRLNQVLHRIKLTPLPGTVLPVLEAGLDLVANSLETLLPVDRYGSLSFPGSMPTPEDRSP